MDKLTIFTILRPIKCKRPPLVSAVRVRSLVSYSFPSLRLGSRAHTGPLSGQFHLSVISQFKIGHIYLFAANLPVTTTAGEGVAAALSLPSQHMSGGTHKLFALCSGTLIFVWFDNYEFIKCNSFIADKWSPFKEIFKGPLRRRHKHVLVWGNPIERMCWSGQCGNVHIGGGTALVPIRGKPSVLHTHAQPACMPFAVQCSTASRHNTPCTAHWANTTLASHCPLWAHRITSIVLCTESDFINRTGHIINLDGTASPL